MNRRTAIEGEGRTERVSRLVLLKCFEGCLEVCLEVCLGVCLGVCLEVCIEVCIEVCLEVCLEVCIEEDEVRFRGCEALACISVLMLLGQGRCQKDVDHI